VDLSELLPGPNLHTKAGMFGGSLYRATFRPLFPQNNREDKKHRFVEGAHSAERHCFARLFGPYASPLFFVPTSNPMGEPVAAFDVFSGSKWVEPSEPIAESSIVALPPGNALAYKATLKVVSGAIWWTAEAIVGDTQD
jgi:hypothetical protein